VEATYWASALELSGKATHLFTTDGPDAATPEETYGGYTAAELQKLPPRSASPSQIGWNMTVLNTNKRSRWPTATRGSPPCSTEGPRILARKAKLSVAAVYNASAPKAADECGRCSSWQRRSGVKCAFPIWRRRRRSAVHTDTTLADMAQLAFDTVRIVADADHPAATCGRSKSCVLRSVSRSSCLLRSSRGGSGLAVRPRPALPAGPRTLAPKDPRSFN